MGGRAGGGVFFLLLGRVRVDFFLLFGRGPVYFSAVGAGGVFVFFAVWAGDGNSLTYRSAWLVFRGPNNKNEQTAKKIRVPELTQTRDS